MDTISFGFQRQPRIFVNDTQRLAAYVYEDDDETPIPLTEIDSVTFSVRRPEDDDRAAYIIHDGIRIEAAAPGAFGNAYTVTFVDPGTAAPLDVFLSGMDLVVTLAHDGTLITSVNHDVVEAIQNDVTIYPTLTAKVAVEHQVTTPVTAMPQTHLSRGEGPVLYRVVGTIEDDGLGTFIVPASINNQAGEYEGMARFTLSDGQIKSVPVGYDCIDTFEDVGDYAGDAVVDQAWRMLEDCFDSELGGPWLRDMTMARFDKTRFRSFIGQALMDINNQVPQTDFTEDSFPYGGVDGGDALFSQGLLCAAIRHLMRSYTEQPDVANSPVGFLDRKRYQQAWKAIYDVEWALYLRWLALYKRRLFNQGPTRLLISSKAGRLYGPNVRTRNIGRGMYYRNIDNPYVNEHDHHEDMFEVW